MAVFEMVEFLEGLTDQDRDWILNAGVERQVIANTQIIEQGEMLEKVFIVLDGVLSVFTEECPQHDLALVGLGEFVGELSFIEGRAATASVRARENSLLLEISSDQLTQKLQSDDSFSARFHVAVAKLMAQRLRNNARQLQPKQAEDHPHDLEVTQVLTTALNRFKALFLQAEEMERTRKGGLTEELSTEFLEHMKHLEGLINDLIGSESELSSVRCEQLGRELMKEMLPYLFFSRIAERSYSKPRGYAGDFMTIEWIYQNKPEGQGPLGALMDQAFLDLSCGQAVRNRRGLITEQIERACQLRPEGPIEITSLACGPAREVYDHYQAHGIESRVNSHLIDIDEQALEFVDQWREEMGLESKIDLQRLNLVYLSLGRGQLDVPPQDLIYSIGLIDYFSDEFVVRFLNYIHGLLRPGGRVVLGNFHTSNRSRALMDHLLDWKLIHRDEADMNRIFRESKFGRDCTEILYEEQKLNLFACCERDH